MQEFAKNTVLMWTRLRLYVKHTNFGDFPYNPLLAARCEAEAGK